jgi:hypothetical protein
MPPEIKPKTALALFLHGGMKRKGLSVQALALATDVGYERARTSVTGDKPPSRRLLREICRVLQLDFKAADEMLVAEQVKRKYGHLSPALASGDPDLRSIEMLWPELTPQEKEHVAWLVTRYAEKKSQKGRATTLQRMAPRPVRTS